MYTGLILAYFFELLFKLAICVFNFFVLVA